AHDYTCVRATDEGASVIHWKSFQVGGPLPLILQELHALYSADATWVPSSTFNVDIAGVTRCQHPMLISRRLNAEQPGRSWKCARRSLRAWQVGACPPS